ncbi:MAG: hypothetical protein NC097_04715 [Clostridium sp.]|nr:hypothetical protein [Prevotella sp.]MCM1429079.1 hypothetical protein [Clostridium sp.]MCM1475390.1 hypothetical protein [Muribaculaceae bacterium]
MKSLRLFIVIMITSVGILLSGCISDDFTTSSSDVLTFSTDTVSFDTVFTGIGTPTARLKVYNRAKKSINISSIRFKKSDSNFTFNVDGVSGSSFSDVEIRGGDSIFIFLECFIPESASKKPALVEDELLFLTNGVEQKVLCEAWGQNVIRMKRTTIDKDMTLGAEQPYVLFDTITIAQGATLKIEPGAQVLFHDKAFLNVKGRIEAVGKPGKMIDIRGDRLDNVLPDVGYDILAGQWGGIRIHPESFDNRLEYVNMRSSSAGLVVDSCANLDQRKLLLVNSWLHNCQASALKSSYSWVDSYGCVFSESADAVVNLTGGRHEFIQCTLANNYLFSAISQPLLSIFHCMPDHSEENSQPLMQLSLENSIIYGLAGDINEGDLSGSNVYLRNVLLKSNGNDDDHFIDCIWGEDPLFYTIRADYYFNYRVKDDSPAIGAGNPAFVGSLCRIDMDGLSRLGNGNPTLGAYVYTPEPAGRAIFNRP